MNPGIRLATSEDGAALAAIYAPAVSAMATSFELDPPDADEMGRRVRAATERTPWLVCEADGRVIGYAYASRHRERLAYQWSVDVSAYISADAHRRGIGRALYTSLFAILRLQGFCNAYAGITVPNPASFGLHAAMGFELVGIYRNVGFKFGRWHDVAWLGLALADYPAAPLPPAPLREVSTDPRFAVALGAGMSTLRLT